MKKKLLIREHINFLIKKSEEINNKNLSIIKKIEGKIKNNKNPKENFITDLYELLKYSNLIDIEKLVKNVYPAFYKKLKSEKGRIISMKVEDYSSIGYENTKDPLNPEKYFKIDKLITLEFKDGTRKTMNLIDFVSLYLKKNKLIFPKLLKYIEKKGLQNLLDNSKIQKQKIKENYEFNIL